MIHRGHYQEALCSSAESFMVNGPRYNYMHFYSQRNSTELKQNLLLNWVLCTYKVAASYELTTLFCITVNIIEGVEIPTYKKSLLKSKVRHFTCFLRSDVTVNWLLIAEYIVKLSADE